MAMVTGLQSPHTLAGVVSMSGYLVAADRFTLSDAAKGVPTLQCHGTADGTVQMAWGVQSRVHDLHCFPLVPKLASTFAP